ncbi:SIS domain-containing protein [Mailhella massiliensis]|uniref:KpsF/GutQ family sugar-phosphate isomerase n=1 Tax=Mailhella massiliensis TaxID=1903261 RepID=A0A921DR96_9BACT|nr:KpsF/GutQ family sugar-phosphate isomerase [Mailhella massiliensis]HJD97445.1 KpsF/GutQ family sugar-phosphate isomerase [Mailhella massiliensis]
MKYLDEARQVLRDEAQALQILADSLGEHFEKTVDCLLGIKGRIAVTGMGKSGHVARKIAATLASTGSPAYFIHPAEASHGDLGMMTPEDAVIAISNSGNTAELTDIVLYASQNNMPLIAITRNADSFLGKHCDYLLLQPQLHEACPLDCAPTTSTTVQMALGDALAMCLLTARGFGREDFRRFHPGGSLGQKLSLVRDLMHTGGAMPLLQLDAPMMSVLAEMTRKGFGCVGVMDGEKLVGIITDGDLRRHMGPDILESSARDLMTRNPVCVDADALSAKAQGIMEEKKITCVFIVDEEHRPLGILSMHDIL